MIANCQCLFPISFHRKHSTCALLLVRKIRRQKLVYSDGDYTDFAEKYAGEFGHTIARTDPVYVLIRDSHPQ